MSFTSYLKNMAIDGLLGIVGLLGLLAFMGALMQKRFVAAVVFLAIGGLSILYTRYRKQEKGITY